MDEVIPCPNRGPRDEHQQHTELEVQQRQKDWQEAFHDEAAEPVGDRQRSPAEAGGLCGFLLKLTYSLGYVEIIDVLAAHLQRVFAGGFRVTRLLEGQPQDDTAKQAWRPHPDWATRARAATLSRVRKCDTLTPASPGAGDADSGCVARHPQGSEHSCSNSSSTTIPRGSTAKSNVAFVAAQNGERC